jgi:tetratricopeptide (TPR) repeat protein
MSVIDEDCDYQQVCEKHQPDLTLFESGVYGNFRNIQNITAHSRIPKLGFCHADAYCLSRESFISNMAHWGIETFFAISISMGEYTPEIADNLFIWPNFVDSDLYRDYGEEKIHKVLLTGSFAEHYPFRTKISKILSAHYPSLSTPHYGWFNAKAASSMIYGESYARLLNASWFVPTCGTIAKEVVRKHFEIPASKACLITEKTPALVAAGFIDMKNCIFVDESNVLDKVSYLFHHPDEIASIINAGYQLVNSRHTLKHRNQIFQWYTLYKNLESNQEIVQPGPFEPLIVVDKRSGIKNCHVINSGLDRELLQEGDKNLSHGRYVEAEALYRRCINYHAWIPEPKLKLALCCLYQGSPELAISWLLQPIRDNLECYHCLDPEPVEWAYLIIALLCKGELEQAIKCAEKFPSLFHPELERVRWVIHVLKKDGEGHVTIPITKSVKRRYSVHQLPERTFDDWIEHVCSILKACKQFQFAQSIKSSMLFEYKVSEKETIPNGKVCLNTSSKNLSQEATGQRIEALSLILKIADINWFEQLSLNQRIKVKLKRKIKKTINKLIKS